MNSSSRDLIARQFSPVKKAPAALQKKQPAQVGELISDLVRDLEVSAGASECVCVCVHGEETLLYRKSLIPHCDQLAVWLAAFTEGTSWFGSCQREKRFPSEQWAHRLESTRAVCLC